MAQHKVVSRSEWLAARQLHLAREKEFTRLRDQLSAERRELPWLRIDKDYVFEGPAGICAFGDIFDECSQLIVYHFMFDPEWESGCKSCSFWADNFNGIGAHLKARDVAFAAISLAPLQKLQAYAKRLGWSFPWYSSFGSDFNYDFGVSFRPEDLARGWVEYNYERRETAMTELPGVSVFSRDEAGAIYHTYSCYSRGLDMLNGAYHHLDLTPKGRDEDALEYPMAWIRPNDMYGK